MITPLRFLSLRIFDINGEPMKNLLLPGVFLPNDEGAPNLPGFSRMIAIPQGAEASFKIISSRVETINNVEIAPAPRIPLESDNSPLHFEKNMEIYSKNAFYPQEPVKISSPNKIRGVDVVMLGVTPFQYNPVTKELIVIRDLVLEIGFIGGNGQFGDNRLRSRWWDPVLKETILNSGSLPEVNYSYKPGNPKPPITNILSFVRITQLLFPGLIPLSCSGTGRE